MNATGKCGARVLIIVLISLPACAASSFDAIEMVVPHGKSAVYTLEEARKTFWKQGRDEQFHAEGITFHLTYEDHNTGFWDPEYGASARERLHEVLSYAASVLGYTGGELDIQVQASELDGTGALASAGTPYPVAPGIHPGATLYRLNTGEKLAEGIPEITLKVDFGRPFALGPALPAADQFDLHTVLLHEITHGIGFSTRIGSTGGSTSFVGGYSIFDALLTDRSGTPLLTTDGVVPYFQSDPAILTSFDVAFSGTYATAQYGQDLPVPVYASPPFRRGSSVAHWAFGSVSGDVLMEPALPMGLVHRTYTPQDLGAVIDLRNYSRGDGRAGDGPMGCRTPTTASHGLQARIDMVLLGAVAVFLALCRATFGQNLRQP